MIGQESAQHMSSTQAAQVGCWAERFRREAELKLQIHSLMIARFNLLIAMLRLWQLLSTAKGYGFTMLFRG